MQRRRSAPRLLKGNFEPGFRGVCVCAGGDDSTNNWQSVFPANWQALVAPPMLGLHTLFDSTDKEVWRVQTTQKSTKTLAEDTMCFFFLKTTAFNLIPTLLSVHGYKRWSDLACLEPPDQKSIKLVHMQPRSNYVRPALPSVRRHNTPFFFFCVQVRAQAGL